MTHLPSKFSLEIGGVDALQSERKQEILEEIAELKKKAKTLRIKLNNRVGKVDFKSVHEIDKFQRELNQVNVNLSSLMKELSDINKGSINNG